MQVNHANLESIYYSLDARFQQAFDAVEPWAQQVATEVPSATRENRYGWIGQVPRLREWIGERYVHNLANMAYALQNKDFELTIGVDRNDIEDDQLGQYGNLAAQMGYEGRMWPQDLVAEVLKNAHELLAFDGQAFFDTDHPVDINNGATSTYSNLFASRPLNAVNLQYVRSQMRTRSGADGHTLRVRPNLLVVDPSNEATALTILNAETIAPTAAFGGNAANVAVSNIMKNVGMQVLVAEELADEPGAWYVLDTTKPIKPIIFQLRKQPEFVALDQTRDRNVFHHKKFLYGIDSRGNAGLTLPFLAARATP